MDDTGAEWQQQLGDWWQSDKPWLRHSLHLESEKQRDWFSGGRNAAWWSRADERGRGQGGRVGENPRLAADWRCLSQTGQPLPCADLWLGGKAVSELAQAQIVVQLGSSLTGKRVLQWQATCEPEEYWLVDNLPGVWIPPSTAVAVWSAH
jgi:2-succinyl-5-enolpyruvyl-6-hydroxy-3-cyclohexene-1-carboxylate synthase